MEYKFKNFEEMLREINRFFYAEFGKKGNITLLLDDAYYQSTKMYDYMGELTLHNNIFSRYQCNLDFMETLRLNFDVGTMTVSSYRNMELKLTECIKNEIQQVISGAK